MLKQMHALALSISTIPSNETMVAFHLFHPLAHVNLPPFINDFHLEMEVTLDQEAFIFTLACSSRLSSNSLLSTMYELLQNYFVTKFL
jgi:hypothetical protein